MENLLSFKNYKNIRENKNKQNHITRHLAQFSCNYTPYIHSIYSNHDKLTKKSVNNIDDIENNIVSNEDVNLSNSSKTSNVINKSKLIKNIYNFNPTRKTIVLSDYLDNNYESQFEHTVLSYLTNSNKN